MMKVATPQGEMTIKFHHIVPFETQCRIYKGEEQVATGFASCSDEDNFSREVGRKVSMSRALLHAGFPKEVRQQIWSIYLTRKNG